MKADSVLVQTVSPSPNFGDRNGRPVDAMILHYTGMSSGAAAQARLLDPASQVSCHYLVWEDGRIEQMVAEADRAWHAGRSFWAGERDMNTVSIGIEIVNGGHDYGSPPYPDAQIEAVIGLARDICSRHKIVTHRVLAHSDIAPDRKCDPGEWFPWQRLAAAGVGLWIDGAHGAVRAVDPESTGPDVLALQADLRAFGYDGPLTGIFDAATACVVKAFQRHYRPVRVDGNADSSTIATLDALLGLRP